MEEKMLLKGLREVNSSEAVNLWGGAKKSAFADIVEKIRNFIDFIADYIPHLIKGFTDGMMGKTIIE